MVEHITAAAARMSDGVQYSTTPSRTQAIDEIVESENKRVTPELTERFSARRSIALIGGMSLLLWVVLLVSVHYV
jgi:CHASE3 domain sensor protein